MELGQDPLASLQPLTPIRLMNSQKWESFRCTYGPSPKSPLPTCPRLQPELAGLPQRCSL